MQYIYKPIGHIKYAQNNVDTFLTCIIYYFRRDIVAQQFYSDSVHLVKDLIVKMLFLRKRNVRKRIVSVVLKTLLSNTYIIFASFFTVGQFLDVLQFFIQKISSEASSLYAFFFWDSYFDSYFHFYSFDVHHSQIYYKGAGIRIQQTSLT